ncbi:A/G-specific adenine glycosylase [Legionella jordanis]|uniref:A/G-specific adenine glycosylase n=1 Tax=Legionella jordanis TaxID=456 RepID=UPI000EFE7912|nr:A/G-specific adenine glycosylase [Legionella jordanis]RMX21045.1 A/G-specific adenine glycosylase [Legionella jordanis]
MKIHDVNSKAFEALQQEFSGPLLRWFDSHGRKDLPWQNPRTPYQVWVSEIMLQQTQVKTVIPYFHRFMQRFPSLWHLAQAPEDEVLSLWSGLGYYSRARNLIKTAKIICDEHQGVFPNDINLLMGLPGIGASTAAAITSQAFGLPTAILDGNVKRILCRYFMVNGFPEQSSVKKQLWELANQCMPLSRCADYTQAIMDLGATCCTPKNPGCNLCPLSPSCLAHLKGTVASYPFKKVKKTKPVEVRHFLLLYNEDGKIYLEKRPAAGLWGGLWCMPMMEQGLAPEAYLLQHYDLKSIHLEEMLRLKHSFSHFHLHITALAVLVSSSGNAVHENNGNWFHLNQINQLGLAKPTMSIIKCFEEKQRIVSE